MTDLKKRFRALDDVVFPFAEPPTTRRIARPLEVGPSPVRRTGIVLLALAVAVAGFAFAFRAFGSSDPRERDLVGVPDQPQRLAYSAPYGGQWSIFVVQADGTGAERISVDLPGDAFHPSWAPDGQRLVFEVMNVPSEAGGVEAAIYVMQADGSDLTRLMDAAGWNYQPAWSPDGTQIAYVHNGGEGGEDDNIWVMDVDGSNPVRLTDDPAFDLNPAWSPDGSRIAFQSNRDGNNEIYAMNSDGSGETRLTDDPSFDGHPTWSPDGSTIAFAGERQSPGIYTMASDGEEVRQLTSERQVGPLDPKWSPDGMSIAYTTSPEGLDTRIVVVDAATGDVDPITGIGDFHSPAWQPTVPNSPAPTPAEEIPGGPVDLHVASVFQFRTNDVAALGELAVGEDGALWVLDSAAVDPDRPGYVLRVDPDTGAITGRLELGGWASGIAAGAGSVWVVAQDEGRHSVLRLDPSTVQVTASIPLPDDVFGGPIAATADAVWVGAIDDQGPALYRIDPESDEIVDIKQVDSCGDERCFPNSIEVVDGTLWLAGQERGVVTSVDIATGAIRVYATEAAAGLAVIDGAIWMSEPMNDGDKVVWFRTPSQLVAVDVESGDRIADPMPVHDDTDQMEIGGFPFAADADGIWVLGFDANMFHVLIGLFDPGQGRLVQSVEAFEGEWFSDVQMSPSGDTIWVLNSHGIIGIATH